MKNNLYQNKYRIPSARLKNWDYRSAAPYFVTICSKNREYIFGEIENGKMILNDLGKQAGKNFDNINIFTDYAEVVNYVIMPNHVHAIIELKNKTKEHKPNRFGPLLKNHYLQL